MKQEMFVSVSDMVKRCTVRKTSVQGKKVEWLKLQWIQVRRSSPMKLYFKYSIQHNEQHAFRFFANDYIIFAF